MPTAPAIEAVALSPYSMPTKSRTDSGSVLTSGGKTVARAGIPGAGCCEALAPRGVVEPGEGRDDHGEAQSCGSHPGWVAGHGGRAAGDGRVRLVVVEREQPHREQCRQTGAEKDAGPGDVPEGVEVDPRAHVSPRRVVAV